MINLAQLTETDFVQMASEINEISSSRTENELYTILGNALHDMGMTVSSENSNELIRPKFQISNGQKFNSLKAIDFVSNTSALTKVIAEEEGKRLWERITLKLKTTICNDPKIKDLFSGDKDLKEYIKIGIPIVLAALTLGPLSPLAITILSVLFALILKVGFEVYCEFVVE